MSAARDRALHEASVDPDQPPVATAGAEVMVNSLRRFLPISNRVQKQVVAGDTPYANRQKKGGPENRAAQLCKERTPY